MIKKLKNLWFKWQMYRLANDIHACLEEADVRDLQELGREMQAVGDRFNSESWREEGKRIELNAEAIVMDRVIR